MIQKTIITPIILLCSLAAFSSELQKGYRGFVDFNTDLAFPKTSWGDTQTDAYYGISTSHGYQLNPHLFIGGGLETELFNEGHTQGMQLQIPYFIHGRTDWAIEKGSLYADIRIGSIINGVNRFYLSPTVGYSFRLGNGSDMYIGAGMNLRGFGMYYNKGLHPQLAMRLGVDFGKAVRRHQEPATPKEDFIILYNPRYKQTPEWRRYKTLNAIGWSALGVGTAGTLFSCFLTAVAAIEGGDAYTPGVIGIVVGGTMMLSSVPLLIVAHHYKRKAKRITINADSGYIAVNDNPIGTKTTIPAFGLSLDF